MLVQLQLLTIQWYKKKLEFLPLIIQILIDLKPFTYIKDFIEKESGFLDWLFI